MASGGLWSLTPPSRQECTSARPHPSRLPVPACPEADGVLTLEGLGVWTPALRLTLIQLGLDALEGSERPDSADSLIHLGLQALEGSERPDSPDSADSLIHSGLQTLEGSKNLDLLIHVA